jgi:hypothetical protein
MVDVGTVAVVEGGLCLEMLLCFGTASATGEEAAAMGRDVQRIKNDVETSDTTEIINLNSR